MTEASYLAAVRRSYDTVADAYAELVKPPAALDPLSRALLATHLNGERLTVDHGYPLRLIAPNRAGVFNTKWLATIEVLL